MFILNYAYSRNSLPKIKDEACALTLDEYKSIESHWMALYVNGDNVKFDSYVLLSYVWILLYWIY